MERMRLAIFLVALLLLVQPLSAEPAPKLLVLGDSLSAAYGIDREVGWVSLLQQRIRSRDLPHEVINASISGETTAGGLARLPDLLERHSPEVVLVALGGNDGLRGQPPAALRENLRAMISAGREAGAEVAIFAMRIPSNYGPTYTQAFEAAFEEAAEATDAVLVPFLLADIASDPEAFLDDGIHPSASAQPLILDRVWPHIAPLLGASKNGASRN